MLDAFIIEQIRKREERSRDQRPFLELPLPSRPSPEEREEAPRYDKEEEGERGVIVIDFA